MGKYEYFKATYISGIEDKKKEKSSTVGITPNHIEFSFGILGARERYVVGWNNVVGININGSSDPAFSRVPAAIFGFPGLQSVSTKTVRNNSQVLLSVSYLALLRMDTKKIFDSPNTARFLLESNVSRLEGVFARYMHIVEQNAAALAALQGGVQQGEADSGSIADRLSELAELHRQGLLTKAEFDKAKKKLLG